MAMLMSVPVVIHVAEWPIPSARLAEGRGSSYHHGLRFSRFQGILDCQVDHLVIDPRSDPIVGRPSVALAPQVG
jgi:hypothetical protein